jgi:hypothetical protein
MSSSPRVFVSYSHDTEEHKNWVRGVAEELRRDGVDVVLDQWEIGPGDDVTAFMEKGLSLAERVLVICTDRYVAKAKTLKGGVGYERMIVTAEVARHLETRKFIPILRTQTGSELPPFLGSRLYIDFRNPTPQSYEELLRSLLDAPKDAPKHVKPPIGRAPNALSSTKARLSLVTPTQRSPAVFSHNPPSQGWSYHWHSAVHEFCGNRLHLIFVKFAADSIFFKDSIIDDLRASGISDYMIFFIFSRWDLLIRIWADDEAIRTLRRRFAANRDLDRKKKADFLVVEEVIHISDGPSYADPQDAMRLLSDFLPAELNDAQARGQQSGHFAKLEALGLILPPSIRFDPERIQFYITISSLERVEKPLLNGIKRVLQQRNNIFNRTVYITPERHPCARL